MQIALKYLNFSEYIEREKSSKIRHEYLGGQVFAMSRSSEEHNLIAGNLLTRLRSHLRGSGCRTFMSDMKVRIETADVAYYPDVMVVCDSEDRDRYFKTRPCLIVEILSPSTAAIDKREKWLNYQKIPSLQEYVVVSQDEIQVEVYRKDAQGNWTLETLSDQNELRLNSVGLTMTMSEIYEDIFQI